MKKKISIFIGIVLLIAILTGCGAVSKNEASDRDTAYPGYPQEGSVADGGYGKDDGYYGDADAPDSEDSQSGTGGITKSVALSEKIIYSLNAGIETVEFDKTIDDVYGIIDEYGGFIETSSVSGQNYASKYYGGVSYRRAEFIIRVPVDRFEGIRDDLNILGNVTRLSTNAQNITASFTDMESRLKSLRTEESRLLAILEKAETVEDMITIENRLSQVRYEVESITSTLTNWQNQVDYSTIVLSIEEVEKLTEKVEIHRTYWQEIGDGISATFKGIGRFFTGLFKWFVIALPVLVIFAAVLVVIVVLVRRQVRKQRASYAPYRHDDSGRGEDKQSK